MRKTGKYIVTDHLLCTEAMRIPVGSNDWFAWLSEHDRFSFEGKNGHFTAQRETRRNKTFWYAYRRRDKKLFKQYLGKTDELTIERLEQASLSLAGKNLLVQYGSQLAGETPYNEESRIDSSALPGSRVNLTVLPSHLISRSRLIRQFTTHLVLIYAPSGFGKTTLLNDWRRTCGHPVAWLSLEDRDNHPLSFWCSVILALQAIRPDFGAELLSYLQTASPVHLADVVSWLSQDLASIQGSLPGADSSVSLVLEDFHRVNHPEIYDSLQVLLEHFPPNLQLIISGQTKPPLSLGSLRARGLLTELDASDLRFTLEEGIHYLREYHWENPLAYADLEKLVKHSEGWAAGLTLTALALGKQDNRRQFIDTFSGAHIYLREYFLETVLQRSGEDVQDFLLKTAILKQLTGSLCDAVTGQTGGEEMLVRLWQENLFIIRLEEPGWYRYHDLFAEMLQSQLRARFPEEVAHLHQRAAQWYQDHNVPADAVYHLLATNAWEDAASLIEAMALRELEFYGEDSRLLRWLQELPETIVQKHKTLLLVYLRLADVALPRQKIERFIARIDSNLTSKPVFHLTPDERDVLAEIQSIRKAWEQGGHFPFPPQGDGENDARWEVLDGLHLLKQGYGPNPEGLEHQLTNLLQKAQTQHNLFVVLMVGGVLAGRVAASGQLRRGEKIARQVLEQALVQRGKLPEPSSIALAALSQIALERSELDLAQQYLVQAREVDPNPTSTNMVVQMAILQAKLQVEQKKFGEAVESIQAIRDLHSRRPSAMWTDQDLLAYEAMIHVRGGDILSAEKAIHEVDASSEGYLSQFVRAEIFLKKKQPDLAEKLLEQIIARYPSGTLFEPLLDARVMISIALFDQHKINLALQAITDAVRQAAPERIYGPFLECGDSCVPLLIVALKTEKLSADAQTFIKETLRAFDHTDTGLPDEINALSTSASISQREQEVLQLLSSGCSNRDIAGKLCISESTVKTHLANIYDKLGANSRMQAVRSAKELNLIR